MDFMNNFVKQILNQESNEIVKRYEHDDWFAELANIEIAFFAGLIELYENDPKKFLERIANGKEQVSYIKFLLKSAHNAKIKSKVELVHDFYKQVPLHQIIDEVCIMAQTLDYVVEKNAAQYSVGKLDGDEFLPFDESALREGKLHVSWEGEEVAFSIQSVIYFAFVNASMTDEDKKRAIGCQCDYPEELYAFAYGNDLLRTKLDSFNIKPTIKYVTSTLSASIVYSKGLRFLNDILQKEKFEDDEQFNMKMHHEMDNIFSRAKLVFFDCATNYLDAKVKKLEQKEKQQLNKHTELQKKLEKQKEKHDQQVEKVKQLKQQLTERPATTPQNQQAEASLKAELASLKQQLKDTKEDLKEEKKKHTKDQKALQKKYDELVAENEKLINDVRELQKQLTIAKREKLQTEELTFDKWLEKGQELLRDMSLTEEEQLKGFIDLAQHIMEERSLSRPSSELATNRIGYCKVGEDGYFINFGDHDWKKISSIPTSIYLSDGQFVEVTKDLALVNAFDSFFTEGPMDYNIAHFAVVEERHNEAYAKVNGITTKIKYRENMYILNDQVISINQSNEIVGYYTSRSITLDDLLPSINLKGHEPLYVVMVLANGYVVRNLDDAERFVQLEDSLLPHSFIVLDENEKINYKDISGQLFKRSSKYKKKLLASVSETEEQIYVLKSNQEYVQLNDIPQGVQLELGDMIWVDEFNRFIELMEVEEQYIPDTTIEQKLLDSGHKVTRKVAKTQVVKDKELLIIGNIRLSERYKKYFADYGYNVGVVDGTGPFEKIKQACSKYNTILYSTAFTSHKNSGKMSREVSKPYILCDSTAPKVMHYTLEMIG